MKLLQQLSEFQLGRFLLTSKGLNGYWTAYLISRAPPPNSLHPLEKWVLHSAPAVKATRERFHIFKQVLQDNLMSGVTIASIPCGVMDDLVSLDIESFEDITFVGIDYDQESIKLAKANSESAKGAISCSPLSRQNKLDIKRQVISSTSSLAMV